MTNGDLRVWPCHLCVWVGPVSGSEDLKRVGLGVGGVILGSVGTLGAPTAGKNTWLGTQGVSPKGRARCTRTQSQCWGHLRPQETSSEAVLTSLLAGSGVR